MHVHPNYSQQLAILGTNRDEVQEMAARRAAEVRRRLAAATDKLLSGDGEDVTYIHASPSVDPGSDRDGETYSPSHSEQPEESASTEREHGSLFSARA